MAYLIGWFISFDNLWHDNIAFIAVFNDRVIHCIQQWNGGSMYCTCVQYKVYSRQYTVLVITFLITL